MSLHTAQNKTTVGRLQKGQSCGDTLNSILKGTGWHVLERRKGVRYLQTLSKIAEIFNDSVDARKFNEKGNRRLHYIAQENAKRWTLMYTTRTPIC